MRYCNLCGSVLKEKRLYCYTCSKNRFGPAQELPQLSEKERHYRFNMIKGRMAETLIQELFLSQGFNVYRYGMESTIPGVMKLLTGVPGVVSEHIKRMPDFVVQNPTTCEVFFVEVKYRSNGRFSKEDLPQDYPYRNSHLILVSRDEIQCVTIEELLQGAVIEAGGSYHLGNRGEFSLPQSIINEFCDFARTMYSQL